MHSTTLLTVDSLHLGRLSPDSKCHLFGHLGALILSYRATNEMNYTEKDCELLGTALPPSYLRDDSHVLVGPALSATRPRVQPEVLVAN